MAISNQYGDREYKKFIESTSVAGQIGVVVLNPDGSNISGGGGGGGGSTTQYADGTAVAGGQVGIVNMASDGSNLQFLSSNSSGELNLNNIGGTISLPTGAATESTLNSALTKLTDIETNTDALATVTKTTVGSDTGLDVNVISGINVEVDLDAADDSVLVYGFDGASNQKIATDANGHLQVDVLSSALPSGAATEATLTDIETNTDSLAVVGGGTEATAVRVTLANDSTGLLSVDDNGGSLTVDNAGLTELAAAINSSKVDVNISSDGAGLATQTTLAAVETDTGSIDTKLTTTNSKLTDIETNTDSLAGLTKTTVSSDTGLDVNIIGGVALDVNLSNANDDVLIYGFDGSSNQKIKTDSSGNLQVDIVADAAGLATQATLANLDTTATAILADTAAIDTSTASIDTKLTTTNSKLTDIETNTDFGATTGGGTESGALRVTLANNSTGLLSVDDNGGSLTVDDGGGSLTIDGAVTATVTRQASIQQSQAQGTGNIALAVATGALIKILSVNTKFGAVPTANNLDMTIVDLGNPVFNTIIFSANPGTLGITDISYIPDGEVIIGPAQEFHVTFTNAASTQFGVTITYEIIN